MQHVPAPSALPFWIAGGPETSESVAEVINPYDGSVVGRHAVPSPEQVERAVAAAWAARQETAAQPAAVRAEALMHVSTSVTARAEEIARLITAENGKPLMWARAETHRVASTFRWAAEEARRFNGEFQRLDTYPAAAGRAALVRRFPIGPVLG
ncbi:MAG TPA: aldehyde dehydrogenase family protein, partial [Candidatus Limnocylindrales bacterium]|nr:aldehyde dehydrogenase family protein [Candidatus Limnocylindrales bacterium]